MGNRPHYALVTPAKNEGENIEALVASLVSQVTPPDLWIVLNDGSTDDTHLKLEGLRETVTATIPQFVIVSYQDEVSEYALGQKYSRIVSAGWQEIEARERIQGFNYAFVGILDADSFPEPGYFSGLIEEFNRQPKAGILSGEIFYRQGEKVIVPPQNRDWALGMCRLWRRECFAQAGYLITVSADAVSAARATVMGWSVYSLAGLRVETRELGAKFGVEYYGKSAYIRCLPLYYVVLGALKILMFQGLTRARLYWLGYHNAKQAGVPRLADPVALKYFRHPGYWRLLALWKGR